MSDGTTRAISSLASGNVETPLTWIGSRAHLGDQRVHVDLEGARARRQAEGAACRGRKLARQRDVHKLAARAHEDAGDTARVEGSNVRGIRGRGGHRGPLVGGNLIHPGAGHLDAHPEGRGHATHVLEGVRPVVRARSRPGRRQPRPVPVKTAPMCHG